MKDDRAGAARPAAPARPPGLPPDRAPAAPHPQAVFDAAWLALRAAADAEARAAPLTGLAAAWLRRRRRTARPLQLVDLGSGAGANARFLAPRLPGPQHWRLLDHDPTLLASARGACAGLRDGDGGVACVLTEVAALRSLEPAGLAGAELVCASAVLDLVGAHWLDALVTACVHAHCAALLTLSVDGNWSFLAGGETWADRDDALVRAAFNAHQRADKGLGPALGPDAPAQLAERFARHGHGVALAPSPWRLDLTAPGDAALAAALIDGWRDAASAHAPAARARIDAWHQRRRATLGRPGARLLVGHLDLFACPVLALPR